MKDLATKATLSLLISGALFITAPAESSAQQQPAAAPAHCREYRYGLSKLDLSDDPYFNKVSNDDVGLGQCLVELENLSLEEARKELAAAIDVQRVGCAGRVSSQTASCVVAHAYFLRVQDDLESRADRPICHEYFRSRDNDHPTDEQNARHLQLCNKESADRDTTENGKPLTDPHAFLQGGKLTTSLSPNCPGLNGDQCGKDLTDELVRAGCQSVSLSCNEKGTYCLFTTSNCAAPFMSGDGHHACYYTDTIVHLDPIPGESPFPSEFLCRW